MRVPRRCAAPVGLLVLFAGAAAPLAAQDSSAVATPREPRFGSELLIPLGSTLVPGLGQYLQGASATGAAYSATALAGFAVGIATAGDDAHAGDDIPRVLGEQLSFIGFQVQQSAGLLSAWDGFHRAVPALREDGKYEFLTTRDDLGDLLTAPFDAEFLGRWTTWVNLAHTGLLAGLVLAGRDRSVEYEPYRPWDAPFAASVSFNAGVAEEAAFRGWLLPMLHQKFGQRFWLANAVQAGVFGGVHLAQAGEFAAVIAAWALWEGWLTRRNDWSIRDSIFHHFWYDAVVVTATLLADERENRIVVTFPTIRF